MTFVTGLRALRWIGRLVPPAERDAWLHEWRAEFVFYARRRNGGHQEGWMSRRLIAAMQHAIWLRWRRTWPAGALSDVGSDARFAVRGMRRSPLFSLTVIATLMVGLGLSSAIFSFADGYLFRPLPFPGGNRAYYVFDPHTDIGALTAADTEVLRANSVSRLGFVEWSVANVGNQFVVGDRRIDTLPYEVSKGFRSTLALPLVAGRDFTAADHLDGAPLVAWLTYRFWQKEFGGDRAVIDRVFRLESMSGASTDLRIVGILGPEVASFDLNNPPPDFVVPHRGAAIVGPNRLSFPLVLLPPAMTVEQAVREIGAVLQAERPSSDGRPRAVTLKSLESSQLKGGQPTARVFFAGALLVLILASMNLVHLLLSRGTARAQEIATRGALGASRWRVARLFLVESLTFGAIGIAAGLWLGKGLSVLIAANVPQFPTAGRNLSMVPITFDLRVIGFAVVLGLVVTLVGGLWPAWYALRKPLHARPFASGSLSAAVSHRTTRIILASELTVATIVLVGTVFMGLGIYRYLTQPIGFEYVDRVRVGALPKGGPAQPDDVVRLVEAIRAVPGVAAAGLDTISIAPASFELPGRAVDPKNVITYRTPPGHFEAWGMKIKQGRWFDEKEFQGDTGVAVVNAQLARVAWPDSNPVGATIRVGGAAREVIGVIESRKSLLDRDPSAVVYVPGRESEARGPVVAWLPGGDLARLTPKLHAAAEGAMPNARITVTATTFDTIFARSAGEARFQAPVMAAFGILAVFVAGIGVFGLMSYLVERRRREFGIRLALGARRADVWRAVIRESIQPTLVGLVLGSAAAYALEAVVRSKAFGWQSSGIAAISLVALGLLTVALAAALAPAARAARIDPVKTLKAE